MADRSKEYGEKIAIVFKAWNDLRKTKSFAGMTLDEFKAAIKPSLDARDRLDTLADQTTAALVERDQADAVSIAKVALVVNAVKGDTTEGEDGELYAAMGYIRKSARKTGKTNKPKKTPPAP